MVKIMGKAKKKNIKSAKKDILKASSGQNILEADKAMDNLLRIFQRLEKNK